MVEAVEDSTIVEEKDEIQKINFQEFPCDLTGQMDIESNTEVTDI